MTIIANISFCRLSFFIKNRLNENTKEGCNSLPIGNLSQPPNPRRRGLSAFSLQVVEWLLADLFTTGFTLN